MSYQTLQAVLIFLLCIGGQGIRGQEVNHEFETEAFQAELNTILSSSLEPGAPQGRIALTFANRYNEEVREHPESIQEIEIVSRQLAQTYEMEYELEDQIIITARFLKSNYTPKHDFVLSPPAPEPHREIFKVVENMPRFPGCEQLDGSNDEKQMCSQKLLLQFVYDHLAYPAAAKRAGIEGRCVVQFYVSPEGEITEAKIVSGLGYGIDEEAIRIVESMNSLPEKWTPGRQRGTPVWTVFTLPIKFTL